jgi:hypothetical protein
MSTKFISNSELVILLSKATPDERLGLTRLVDSDREQTFDAGTLQEEISKFGGHGVSNWFRGGKGTGYLDIIDDVAETLKINDREPYSDSVKYYDESTYVTPIEGSKIQPKYSVEKATQLGIKYALEHEQKIIVKVMENAYENMKKEKENAERKVLDLLFDQEKAEMSLPLRKKSLEETKSELSVSKKTLDNIENQDSDEYTKAEKSARQLDKRVVVLEREVSSNTKKVATLPQEISEKEGELDEAIQRLKNFDDHLSKTLSQYDTSNLGAITGTAGLMALANLGGFATYTFLTSAMSTLSFGTLGFGAYTAATSFLSILIGPVGWASLGLWTIFTLGKPDDSKLVLIVAMIGLIRQRVAHEIQYDVE